MLHFELGLNDPEVRDISPKLRVLSGLPLNWRDQMKAPDLCRWPGAQRLAFVSR
jgi:hypothetical protein